MNRVYFRITKFKTEDWVEIERKVFSLLEKIQGCNPIIKKETQVGVIEIDISAELPTAKAYVIYDEVISLIKEFPYEIDASLEID